MSLNLTSSVFIIENSEAVNFKDLTGDLVFTIPILVLTISINLYARNVISAKDKTLINTLLMRDCLVNIVCSVLQTFRYSPWVFLEVEPLCATLIGVFASLAMFNRLVPIAIVVYRYLMVCHAAFCFNTGEKWIWRWIMRIVISMSVCIGVSNCYNFNDARTYLKCMGREDNFM